MDFLQEYKKWLASPALSAAEKAELEAIGNDPAEIESRFYGPLEFGTAGLRGTMAVGLHHMNIHVIRHATQGFASVICEEGDEAKERGIAICMDCRENSQLFARAAAEVCAANGIRVRIFESLRPTPELSFAVRHYGCQAGINITASHNPKEYNGYKVYWADGAQLPPGPAAKVAARLREIDLFSDIKTMPFEEAVAEGRITLMGEETDRAFVDAVMELVCDPTAIPAVADTFKVVYTPFHGTGYCFVPQVLRRAGVKHLLCEPQQMTVDGTFPTVKSPNPENPEGFYLAVALAKENGADIIIGTDPDADRVGLLARGRDGEYHILSGNQTGVLLLDYMIGAMKRSGKLPEDPVALKTIVTTEMARAVAEAQGLRCYDTFTGFKFMAEKKDRLESAGQGSVIFSYEESYGYMLGSHCRDKDGVSASLALTEMAAYYAGRGMTLPEALDALYERYGWYGEKTYNMVMPGLDGLRDMANLMKKLRSDIPREIAGVAVTQFKDYQPGTVLDMATGETAPMELSGSNVVRFELADGTSMIVRPSGTEPKIKVYCLTKGADSAERDANLLKYEQWVKTLQP